jgi:hypothetical protein
LQSALKSLDFIPNIPGPDYSNMNLSQILTREDFRIDLFMTVVCSKFRLSEGMIRRADKAWSTDKLSLMLCSNEDLFIFKTMTQREGDLDDCMSLAMSALNWRTILEETMNQIENSGNDIWITWIGERLDLLEDMGLTIPVMKEINKLRAKYYSSNKTIPGNPLH